MNPTEAERIARELFGVAGRASPLAGERDDNFRLDTAATRYVLKLHAPDTDPAELEFQDLAIAQAGTPLLAGRTTRAGERFARLLSWVDGTPWAEAGPWEPALMRELGRTVARVDRALARVDHPSKMRPHRWNMLDAPPLTASTPSGFVADALHSFHELRPSLDALPWQVIHNDANDHNAIVSADRCSVSLIDFGDIVWAPRVCGLAVACAYAMLGHAGPVRAILPLVSGYHEEQPLTPAELAPLYDLIRTRLAMSVLNAVDQLAETPDNEYLAISQQPIRELVDRLEHESAELAHLRFRDACGYRAVPTEQAVLAHVRLAPSPDVIRLDGGRPGGYLEPRGWYGGEAFATDDPAERRTVHLGIDVWHPAGEPVYAAHDGVVEAVEVRPDPFDFGGVAILRHATADGVPFFTLYGHLSHVVPEPGRTVARNEQIGVLGTELENGGWEPHLHFQLLTTLVGMGTGIHGVAAPSELDVWESISPDPNLILRAATHAHPPARDRANLLLRRRTNLSQALSMSYREPLEIVRGERAYLFDADGNAWLDLVNNVCHVGHAHPRVTAALAGQAAVLNTNTRYLHSALVTYARRLAATLPDPLSVVFLTNSGSEANDLALRLARAHTGRRHLLALEWGYHGNLGSLIDISQYKFDRPGGEGRPRHVRLVEVPDPYRGAHGGDGPAYADDVRRACTERDPAAFIVESFPGCAGQLELAPGYLAAAFAHARTAGAVCIADEVQVGFGRVGSHFWGFETQGVVPDIVTMGKPIGNGHPMGAVVTTPQIARSFANGMEYFNTFGGNPVSAAVGNAVLDVIRDERLQARAHVLGGRFAAGLSDLAPGRPMIGDVRGRGLYLGVELVRDRRTKEPATAEAAAVKEAIKAQGILISTDGPHDNVLKIKPPLVITAHDIDRAVAAIGRAIDQVVGA
jgi:4-aminobutyrate aminotransferase-like enzyme/Ser/Thr protein kinase RdoA (MazF antagonist)